MATKVLVHVGAPKTGTSFVQDLLFRHREELLADGILYPADRFDAHFLAALDLMQLRWGGLEQEAIGRWDALAQQVRDHDGVAIISHEILGRANRLQVARALESFGDAEIHIVMSARDLARQIPAEWQENVKHRRELTYASFLSALRSPERDREIAQWFWAVQEVPDVLARWGDTLPKDQVHLITVPAPGAPPETLWHRFAGVLGIDTDRYRPDDEPANASLGAAEAAMIRRLNEELNGVLPNHHYRTYVREHLVHRGLSKDGKSARLVLPADVHDWARELSRSWVAEVALRGYQVTGELDDLLPGEAGEFVDPDHPDESLVSDAAIRALARTLQETGRLRDVEIELHEIIDDLSAALDRARSTKVYQAKERLVHLADHNPAAKVGLGAYRRLRGRNSRST
ncbi:MAG: hypothetical protein EOO74_03945 [Myxococcales bacterium]|nr:MAG: hypothetical protein EOO74_03945 [Myxococcales bacterium]